MTRADFEEWKDTFATKKWFEMVQQLQDELKVMLCHGMTVNSISVEAAALQTVEMVAKIKVLDEILNFKIEGENE
jgi:hypothetical protein